MLPRAPPHGACPISPTENPVARIELCDEGRPCLQVSLVLLAKSLGATPARTSLVSGSISERGRLARSLSGLSQVFAKMSSRSSAEAPVRDGSGGEASSSASVPMQQQV